jgi:hypothetical protein
MEIRDAVVPQAYTAKDGSEKTAWFKVGTVFIKEDGGMSMSTPLVNGGRVMFVVPKKNDRSTVPSASRNLGGFTEDELKPDEDVSF